MHEMSYGRGKICIQTEIALQRWNLYAGRIGNLKAEYLWWHKQLQLQKKDSPTFYPGLVLKFIIRVAKRGKYTRERAKSLFQFLLHVKKAFLEKQWWQRLSLSETLCWLSVWRRAINCQKPLYQEPAVARRPPSLLLHLTAAMLLTVTAVVSPSPSSIPSHQTIQTLKTLIMSFQPRQ